MEINKQIPIPLVTVSVGVFIAIAVTSTSSAAALASLALMAIMGMAMAIDVQRAELAKHKEILRWFADHVHMASTPTDPDVPDLLKKLLDEEVDGQTDD